MLPGLTTTRAAATVLDAVKSVLSAIRTLPPLFSYNGLASDIRKITGSVPPHSTPAATWSASRSPGSSPGKIQRLCRGMSLKTSWATAKFLASTSGGVCANQSVMSSVLLSDWEPSSNTMTNSAPSGPTPCSECGSPAGKNQRSSLNTSSTLGLPSRLSVVTRHLPSVMIAHSPVWCQCSSRMPPGSRYMFTPETSSESAKSFCVTSRAQPPACWRRGEMLNEDQKNGCVLTSVVGALIWLGHWLSITGGGLHAFLGQVRVPEGGGLVMRYRVFVRAHWLFSFYLGRPAGVSADAAKSSGRPGERESSEHVISAHQAEREAQWRASDHAEG